MADKEATVYIVDLGATMAECHGGRTESQLDWSMKYVWDKICTTVAASRKTWTVGVLGLRSDTTRNPQEDEEGYDNIEVLQEVEAMSLTSLRKLQTKIKPSQTNKTSGDAVSAIIVATDMISKAAPKRLKYNRKIVLVTDGMGLIDGDDFDDLAFQINELGIQLVVMYVYCMLTASHTAMLTLPVVWTLTMKSMAIPSPTSRGQRQQTKSCYRLLWESAVTVYSAH